MIRLRCLNLSTSGYPWFSAHLYVSFSLFAPSQSEWYGYGDSVWAAFRNLKPKDPVNLKCYWLGHTGKTYLHGLVHVCDRCQLDAYRDADRYQDAWILFRPWDRFQTSVRWKWVRFRSRLF